MFYTEDNLEHDILFPTSYSHLDFFKNVALFNCCLVAIRLTLLLIPVFSLNIEKSKIIKYLTPTRISLTNDKIKTQIHQTNGKKLVYSCERYI